MSERYIAHEMRSGTLEALNQAALAISRDLDLETTLQHIVDSARDLVSARYAALGLFNPQGSLETFIYSGLSEEQAEQIDHPPQGRGLLKAVLEAQEPIREADIADHPQSVGFPAGHPSMTAFLGVPIKIEDQVLGNLYLTDKTDGSEFDKGDEELIQVFSSHAALAIKNARLFRSSLDRGRELSQRNRELETLFAVARATGSSAVLEDVVARALDEVLASTEAHAGEIFLLDEASAELVLAVHRGEAPEALRTRPRLSIGEGIPGRVAESGRTMTASDLSADKSYLRAGLGEAGFASLVSVPLKTKGEVLGTLDLASKTQRAFTDRDLALLEAIGHLIGTAVENARLYDEVGRLAVIEERSRIGMDLHDGVIQSIYAVGLTLETVQQLTAHDPDKAGELLDQAITSLNDVIRDIRNFILDLRPRRFEGDLIEGLTRLAREFQANTLVELDLSLDPSLAKSLPPSMSRAVFFTAQEGLANIARHARAEHAQMVLASDDDHAVLRISDDGLGFVPEEQDQSVGHGLANMEARAKELGGSFGIQSEPGAGTIIRLRLPTGL